MFLMLTVKHVPVKQVLFAAVALCVTTAGLAQTHLDSFFTKGARWTSWYLFSAGHYSGKIDINVLYIGDDSVINGQEYHLLYAFKKAGKHQTNEGGFPYPWVSDAADTNSKNIRGGIRVSGEKVWFISMDSPLQELLLYDFALNIGDTVAWKTGDKVVVDIDSIRLSSGAVEKRYHFSRNAFFPDYWIRGVGSIFTLFGAYENTFPVPFGIQMSRSICYDHRSMQYKFYDGSGLDSATVNSCYYIPPLSVGKMPCGDKPFFDIYPNPVSGESISIVVSENLAEVSIVDMFGRTVMRTKDIRAGTHTLSAPPAQGMYLLTATAANGVRTSLRFQKL